ncbi:unnamed protein product [Scytosiphon promiscuus]
MHGQPSSPPPPQPPFMGAPMGVMGNGLHHPTPPPPPAGPWGPQHHQVFNNNGGGGGGGGVGGRGPVNFGPSGFAPIPPPAGPPMHMHPGANGMNGAPGPGMMMMPPPTQQMSASGGGVLMPPAVAGGGESPISHGSPVPDMGAGVAQGMLEAASPQASALALRVEHLVWGMEEMSAGLSMGQLDTLKSVLLDQVARVDEAKLEQVRVQERRKNEEKTSILNQLQHFQQADSAPAPASGATPAAAAATAASSDDDSSDAGDGVVSAEASVGEALAVAADAAASPGAGVVADGGEQGEKRIDGGERQEEEQEQE